MRNRNLRTARLCTQRHLSNYAFEVKRSPFGYDCIDVASINVTLVPNFVVRKVRIRIGRAKKRSVVLVLNIFICAFRSVVLLVGDDHILNLMPVESMIVRNDRSVTSANLKVDDAYVVTICRCSLVSKVGVTAKPEEALPRVTTKGVFPP